MKMKYVVQITLCLSLLFSCNSLIPNREPQVHYNKFRNTSSITSASNYVMKNSGCSYVAFNLHATENESDANSQEYFPFHLFIQIKTENGAPLKITQGRHLWVFADDDKIDLICDSYEGTIRTFTNQYSYYDVCNESALFAVQLEQIKKMANASALTFEVETCNKKPVKGTFSKNNLLTLKNFTKKISSFDTNEFDSK